MSIIEKAVGKLGKVSEQPPAVDAAAKVGQHAPDMIEQAVERLDHSVAKPTTAQVQAPDSGDNKSAVRQIELSNDKLKQMGLISLDGERSQLAEEFRLIKRPLLMNAFGQGGTPAVPNGNMIMVTSSLPGEGKTFSSINLALSIATELDRTVLLVDADVAKPSVLRYLGVKTTGNGLLDVLRNEQLNLGDVLIKTNVENLSILPAGHTYKHATELLASDAMTNLIHEIANRYPDRIVIFDSPPLLATTEASVLASHMGQIVMVVAAESTPEDALKEALARIEDSCDVVGMLLNKANPIAGTDYYYGYYGSYGN